MKIIKVRDSNCEDGDIEFFLEWDESFNRREKDFDDLKYVIATFKSKNKFYSESDLVKALNLLGFKIKLTCFEVDYEL